MYWINIEKIGYISKISDIFDFFDIFNFFEKIMIFSIPANYIYLMTTNAAEMRKRKKQLLLASCVYYMEAHNIIVM